VRLFVFVCGFVQTKVTNESAFQRKLNFRVVSYRIREGTEQRSKLYRLSSRGNN